MRKLLCLLLAALITISTGACTQKPSAPEKPTPSVSGETFSPADYITTGKNTESQSEPISETVYITKTGEKYHRDGCSYLRKSKIAIALSEAQASYSPCSKCNP